jgi:RHS repeat-associated protein
MGLDYDADGRPLRRTDASFNFGGPGSYHAMHDVEYQHYDQRGKATSIRDSHLFTQTYSLLGNLTYFKSLGAQHPGTNDQTTYRVDALGRRMVESRYGATTETIYEYDGYGRMYSAHPPDGYTFSAGSAPLQQLESYDAAGNQEWFTQQNFPTSIVDATRSFFDGNQRLVSTDRQTCHVETIGSSPPQFACRNQGNLDNSNAGSFEWYRYDALGRRIVARTRRDKVCTAPACASTITRFVWDGDQILYEIRAQGGNVGAVQLEDDNAQGPFYGRVAYTHGLGIDQPLEITRMGYTPIVDASYGLNAWNGPYPVMPYSDWHGVMDGATTITGLRIPCSTTPNLCSPGIWPGSNLGAYYEPTAPADHQAWFGSLTTGKTDGSGFMYMRNRYYNPQTGTFTQPDPIGLAGGLNVYGFAEGDPITFSDPMGLCPPRDTNEADCGSIYWAEHYNNSTSLLGKAVYGLAGLIVASQDVSDGRTLWTLIGEVASSRPAPGMRLGIVPFGFGAATAEAGALEMSGLAAAANETRVSRWMSEAEYTAMKQSGTLQTGANGRTYVTAVGAPKPGGTGPIRVDFNVPTSSLQGAGGEGWYQIITAQRNPPPVTGIVRAQ